jgi:serine/threonine protein kinase
MGPWSHDGTWIASGLLPPGDVLSVVRQLAEVLERVHAARFLHCDVNPWNVMVDPATLGTTLIDFGLARRLGSAERGGPQSSEGLEGTFPYIAPEQTGRMNRNTRTMPRSPTSGTLACSQLSAARPRRPGRCTIRSRSTRSGGRSSRSTGSRSSAGCFSAAETASEDPAGGGSGSIPRRGQQDRGARSTGGAFEDRSVAPATDDPRCSSAWASDAGPQRCSSVSCSTLASAPQSRYSAMA